MDTRLAYSPKGHQNERKIERGISDKGRERETKRVGGIIKMLHKAR
jgi:hypothetical protein